MSKEKDFVVIDRIDYDELVKQADMTKAEIEERAQRVFLDRNEIPVRVKFNEWANCKNFEAPISFARHWEQRNDWAFLDVLESQIDDWMKENMRKYSEEMRKINATERDCRGLRKQVANLQESKSRLKSRFSILLGYTIIVTITLIWLSLLLTSGLKNLLQ